MRNIIPHHSTKFEAIPTVRSPSATHALQQVLGPGEFANSTCKSGFGTKFCQHHKTSSTPGDFGFKRPTTTRHRSYFNFFAIIVDPPRTNFEPLDHRDQRSTSAAPAQRACSLEGHHVSSGAGTLTSTTNLHTRSYDPGALLTRQDGLEG